jgi:hypothetical protein
MTRTLVLLATVFASLGLSACSPNEAVAHSPPQLMSASAEKPAPPANTYDPQVWPLGTAP